MSEAVKQAINLGQTALGLELGSTRIKAVLIGLDHSTLASGSHEWENRFENGVWTYSLDSVWSGIQECYKSLADEVRKNYGVELTTIGSIGFSGMMHGYLVFDKEVNQLVPFRTWRNTITEKAAEELTELFGFNIPQRWSIAHLRQAMLNKEEHVPQIRQITTLAGYVHYMLTGRHVLGVGEASGMFPIDSSTCNYNENMTALFDEKLKEADLPYTLDDIMPKVLCAGENGGTLTEPGAKLMDPTGKLKAGIPLCPPEGDAGTGMVATNSITERTGNVSAGTSIFAMVVLEKPLSKCYPEIDMVTTPAGSAVAMVHCNNCTSDINDWADIFCRFSDKIGFPLNRGQVLTAMFEEALTGDCDCGGLFACNYLSGEHLTGFTEGRPLFVRTAKSEFNFANFSRVHIYSAIATLKIGMDLLIQSENVQLKQLLAHGGYFKTKGVGQRIMAAAIGVPVAVMETAAEGGSWGMAVLAAYMKNGNGKCLEKYLEEYVFANAEVSVVQPDNEERKGFTEFIERYKTGLNIERTAIESIVDRN